MKARVRNVGVETVGWSAGCSRDGGSEWRELVVREEAHLAEVVVRVKALVAIDAALEVVVVQAEQKLAEVAPSE